MLEAALCPAPDQAGPVAAGTETGADGGLLRLSPWFDVEQCEGATATIFLASSGTRLRIPRALYEVLLRFETPQSAASVTKGDARLGRALERLQMQGFLVPGEAVLAPPPLRPLTDPPVRLFDCPARKLSAATTDIAVLGVPYDGGDFDAAGARNGPAALRQTSLQLLYALDRRTGTPLGWFDADAGRPVLRDKTIGDCGDLLVQSGEPQVETFARLGSVLAALLDSGQRFCAVLGGDATISFPLVEAMQARMPLGVVRIGDLGTRTTSAPPTFHVPATLADRVLALPNVQGFVQIGGWCSGASVLSDGLAISRARILRDGMAALAPALPAGTALHIGLDVRAMTSPFDVGDRATFGFSELRWLLEAMGKQYRIVSVDLVGLNPMQPGWNVSSVASLHLLLAMLSAALDRDEPAGTR